MIFKVSLNKSIIKLLVLIVAVLFLFLAGGVQSSFNRNLENIFTQIRGEQHPDSNIIIIHITSDDIENIGPWPIKRSYYALLINSLSKYEVSDIGLEVFLSAKFVTQAVYDNLLQREIKKAGNVVLGSVAGSVTKKGDSYFTDSLSYPTPRLMNKNIKTGHLNFIKNDYVKIPAVLHAGTIEEKAFSYQLSGMNIKNLPDVININFISSWKKFSSYSLLEFFSLINEGKLGTEDLKGKKILIGISDPQIASTLKTAFDDELPGIALHAFALDNLLNNRFYNKALIRPSVLIFFLLLFLLIFYQRNKSHSLVFVSYAFVFVFMLTVMFVSFSFLYTPLLYSYFLVPVALLFITDLIFSFAEKKEKLVSAEDETRLLKSLLQKKENELNALQKELELGGDSETAEVFEKIRTLKADIKKLKRNENDNESVDVQQAETENFEGIVYRSKQMRKITELVKKIASEDATVLVLGESGTGKELVAKAIHELSKRKDKNFVAINCGALSDTLLESELFGHIKGAFTGAAADKKGRFEVADGGTIFLDEIGETSENFQVKLLRVVQNGEFEKVGSSKTEHADVRIIAATNKDPEKLVREKKFREDLYYRLNVIKIELPPLRKRKEDIEVIVEHFIKNNSGNIKMSQAFLNALLEYEWKGNVRELEAVIKRGVIFAKTEGRNLLRLNDLPDEIKSNVSVNFEELVLESLRQKNFSHSAINSTADELGNVSRTVVSENFRGFALKTLVKNNYDIDLASLELSGSDSKEITGKVKSKIEKYLENIHSDVDKQDINNFEEIKSRLSSKYKNLPQKFHVYLDAVIKHHLK